MTLTGALGGRFPPGPTVGTHSAPYALGGRPRIPAGAAPWLPVPVALLPARVLHCIVTFLTLNGGSAVLGPGLPLVRGQRACLCLKRRHSLPSSNRLHQALKGSPGPHPPPSPSGWLSQQDPALQTLPVKLAEGRRKAFSASCLPTDEPSGNPATKHG